MYNFSLPIKIGCKVYRVREGYERVVRLAFGDTEYRWEADRVDEGAVSMLQQKADETWKFRTPWGDFTLSEIGKTIFLTEKEAFDALHALQKKRVEGAINGK